MGRRDNVPGRGPTPLILSSKEVDALYRTLGAVQSAFDSAVPPIPWTLTGGSVLGAIRSESILFCDDDIDLAIIGREHLERGRDILRSLEGTTYAIAGGRNGLCWDRLRPVSSSGVWIDVFLLVQYKTIHELRHALQTKRNGSPQDEQIIQAAIAPCLDSSLSSSSSWPIYQFGEMQTNCSGLAIQLWPREIIPSNELPFRNDGRFGPLTNIPLPGMPLRYLTRAFGMDCFSVYMVSILHEQYRNGAKGQGTSEGQELVSKKEALLDEHYIPVMPSRVNERVFSSHDRSALEIKLGDMAAEEELLLVPTCTSLLPTSTSTSSHETSVQEEEPTQTSLLNQLERQVAQALGASLDIYIPLFANDDSTNLESLLLSSSLKGQNVLICSNGSVGEKWQINLATTTQQHKNAVNTRCHSYRLGWGVPFHPTNIVNAATEQNCDAVFCVHYEHPCTIKNDIMGIARCCVNSNILCFVDCRDSFGMDEDLCLKDVSNGITGVVLRSHHLSGVSCAVVVRRDCCHSEDDPEIDTQCCVTISSEKRNKTSFSTHTDDVQWMISLSDAFQQMQESGGAEAARKRYNTRFELLNEMLLTRGFRHWNIPNSSSNHGLVMFLVPDGINAKELATHINKELGDDVCQNAPGCFQRCAIQFSTRDINPKYDDLSLIASEIDNFIEEQTSTQISSNIPSTTTSGMPLVLLVAGAGTRLRNSTDITLPKCMVTIHNKTIMQRMIQNAVSSTSSNNTITSIVLVVGYEQTRVIQHAESICQPLGMDLRIVVNPEYLHTNTSKSVLMAMRTIPELTTSGFMLADGDLICHPQIFDNVAQFPESCAAIERPSPLSNTCHDEEAVRVTMDRSSYRCTAIGKSIGVGIGESIGLYKLTSTTIRNSSLMKYLDRVGKQEYYEDAFQSVLLCSNKEEEEEGDHRFDMTVLDVTGLPCIEVDDGDDYECALTIVDNVLFG